MCIDIEIYNYINIQDVYVCFCTNFYRLLTIKSHLINKDKLCDANNMQ